MDGLTFNAALLGDRREHGGLSARAASLRLPDVLPAAGRPGIMG